jgi:hypothetical protein
MENKKHTNLSNVDMASLVKLVVLKQSGDVQPIRVSNTLTCITGVDRLNSRAVLLGKTDADSLARREVTATLGSKIRVGHIKLVTTVAQPQKCQQLVKSVKEPKTHVGTPAFCEIVPQLSPSLNV